MKKFLLTARVCISAGLLAGCTASVRTPKAFFSKVGAAGSDGLEVVAAFNSSVRHLAGLTLSVSGSYSPPIATSGMAVSGKTTDYTFAYPGKQAFSLHIHGPDSCFPTAAVEQQLGEALQSTLDAVKGLPANGSVAVALSVAGQGIRRYAFSMRSGRAFALKYFVACRPGDGGQALMYAAMLGLHESTHASLSLRKRQSEDPEHRESVAIGSEACLFLSLKDRGVSQQVRQTLSDRLTEAAGGDNKMSTLERCALWRATMVRSHSH